MATVRSYIAVVALCGALLPGDLLAQQRGGIAIQPQALKECSTGQRVPPYQCCPGEHPKELMTLNRMAYNPLCRPAPSPLIGRYCVVEAVEWFLEQGRPSQTWNAFRTQIQRFAAEQACQRNTNSTYGPHCLREKPQCVSLEFNRQGQALDQYYRSLLQQNRTQRIAPSRQHRRSSPNTAQ